MNKISRSASTCAQTIARKLRLTSKRGRLIALFVLVCAAVAVTVTAASSAASLKKLLPGTSYISNASEAAAGRGETRPSAPRVKASARDLAAGAREDVPSLTTDKDAYEPGDTITFTGANWAPGETVTIVIQGDGGVEAVEVSATAGEDGSFTATANMPAEATASASEGSTKSASTPSFKATSSASSVGETEGGAAASAASQEGAVYTATATGGSSGATAQVRIKEGASADSEDYDPDLPQFMVGKIDKAEYLSRREEHINKLRGIRPGQPLDPGARGRAIRDMNRQEGRPDNATSTVSAPMTGTVTEGAFAGAQVTAAASSTLWTAIGPYPLPNGQTFNTNNVAVSGRTVAIAIHPTNSNVAYVGAAQGGVYRTTDGGASWTPLFDNAQSLAVGSIAIAPSQPSTIYVGTGEGNFGCDSFAGVGVYRIDNADGPSPTLTGPLNKDANGNDVLSGWATGKIVVHPTNPDIIFIGTTTGYAGQNCFPVGDTTSTSPKPRGLFRSTNATSANPTFTKLTIAGVQNGGNRSVSDIEFEPGNPNNMLVTVFGGGSAGNDAGVYRTTNAQAAGPTFARTLAVGDTTTTYRTEVAVHKNTSTNQVTVFAATSESNGTFKRSTDGGVTWSAALGTSGFCGGQCTYDIPIAVDPTNANIVYLGGPGDSSPAHILTKVTNALGTPTFTASQTGLHADEHAIEIDPNNTSIIWTGNDGGIFKSTNAASSWTSLNNTGYSATQFVSLAVHSTDANFTIGGTQDNGTECQGPCGTFAGNTWNQADYGDGGFALIDQSQSSLTTLNMYHTYYNQTSTLIGYAYVTSTANAKFQSSPTSNSWSFIGTGGAVGCTSGGGYSCTEAVEFYMPMALGPGTPNPIYTGTDRLHRAATPGASNTTVSQTFVSGVPISAIGISPQNDSVRIVGMENGQVFRTMTAQTSGWPDVTGTLPTSSSYYLSRAVIDPNNQNTAYVTYSTYFGNSTTAHVYKTTNLNATTPTWTSLGVGTIPDIPVNAFVVDPADSNKLYAGTDIGVYRSTDGGATWAPYSNGLPRVAVFDMAIQNPNRILRIATHGRGMWEISLNEPVNPGTLQGTVTDSSTSGPVSGATVTAGSNTTTTNASGFYQFSLQPGTYSVSVTAPGYNNSSANATVTSDNTTTRNFSLTPAPTSGCPVDTTQADFQAGTASNVDLTTTPGSVILASSAAALDQQMTNTSTTGNVISTTSWQAQTFVPGVAGKLTQVDASLFCSGCSGANPDITFEIRTTSGGLPTTTVLASTTVAGFSSGSSSYMSAVFSNPPTLSTGTTYAVVARLLTARATGSYAWLRSSNNQYANGAQITTTNSGGIWTAQNTDLAFKTYMSTGFTASGDLTSSTKDANPAVGSTPNWTTLSWTATTPANTTLRFQVAASNSASGPFNFVGTDGTSATFYTTSGASLSQFNGKRYLKYKAYLSTTNSSATPTLQDVTVCFSNAGLPATVTAVSPASGTYGGTAVLSATLTSNGSPLSGKLITFTLNGGGVGSGVTNASGVATLSNASLAGINAGSYPAGVGASFAADGSYAGSSGSNTLTVNKATPTLTWSNPADIVYGTSLSGTQLNATASVPGSFVYTPAAGVVLGAGNGQTLHVAFTPTDTTNYANASKDVTVNVSKATLTVKADDKTRAYGAANPAFTYTMTGFTNGDTQASAVTGQPSLTTTATPTSAPGPYAITAAAGTLAAANYNFTFAGGTLTVTKADQTITFGALADKIYGDADFTVSATASSGLPVSFAASGKCSVSGSTAHLTGAGSCTVTASQGGDTNYNAAPNVQQSFNIGKANSTTTVSVSNATYNGQPHGGTASVTGFGGLSQTLTVTYTGRNGTNYPASTNAPTDAGDYTASASFAGDADHNNSSDSKDYTIAKANAVINVTPYSVTYDGQPHTATGTAAGVESPSPANLSALLDLSLTTHTDAGTYPNDAWTFAGNNNYNPASGTVADQIDKAASTVTVNCPSSETYTGNAIEPCTASYSGAGNLSGSLTPSYNNNVNVGMATASASYGGDANHNPSSNSATFQITPAPTATVVTCPASETYTGSAITPCSVMVTGANLSLSPTPSYADNVNVGTATASYSYAGDANHTGSSDSKTFQIVPASSTTVLTFEDGPYVYRGSAFTAAATVTGAGGLNAPVSVVYTGDCTNVTTTGGCTATATYEGDANHSGSSDTKSITITKATAGISLSNLTQTYTGSPLAATAATDPSGLSGVSVTYNGSGVAPTNAGSYAVVASLNNQNYQSDGATGTLVIGKAAPLVTATGNNCTYNGGPCAGSGAATGVDGADLGAVTLTYNTQDGSAPTNAGSYTVVASVGETANHTAGSSAPAAINIGKAAPTVSVNVPSGTITYDGQPHPASAYAYGVGGTGDVLAPAVTITYNGSADAPLGAGSYAVVASFAGNDNYLPASNNSTSIVVGKATPTVSVTGGTYTYDGAAHPAAGFAYGVGGVSDVLTPAVTFTYNGGAAEPVNAAVYNVVASFAGNANYNPATNIATVTINKATPTISWNNPADIVYGTALSGTQLNATASVPGSFVYTPAAGTVLNAGSGQTLHVDFTPTDATDYTGASRNVYINVSKAGQTITFGALANKTYGDAPFQVSATGGGSGNPVTFAASGNCTSGGTNGATITITGAGSCTVTASQAGNGNYNAAPDVARSFSIAKAAATITLSNLYYLYDGTPKSATATTSPVGLTGVTITYVGTTLVYNSTTPPSAAGTYTVTATLTNANYAAPNASATFVINAAPAVTITAPASGAIYTKGSTVSFAGTFADNPGTHTAVWTFTSGTQTLTQAGMVNEATGAISASYTFPATGVYLVKLTVTDNFNVIGEATTVNNVAGAPALVAVYDPSSTGGSVSTTTKSPLYNSLAGWYALNPSLTGTATTGFNASYPSATATAPTGQAVFNFAAAGLSMTSLSYQWMVVSKPYVWLRGSCTVNNVSGYEFLIAAVDGQLTGGGGSDKFRVRIWRKADGLLVYDNLPGGGLNAVATTVTSNGDIAIK